MKARCRCSEGCRRGEGKQLLFRGKWAAEGDPACFLLEVHERGEHAGGDTILRKDKRPLPGDGTERTTGKQKDAIFEIATSLYHKEGRVTPGDVVTEMVARGMQKTTPSSLRGLVRRRKRAGCSGRRRRGLATWSQELQGFIDTHNRASNRLAFSRVSLRPVVTRLTVAFVPVFQYFADMRDARCFTEEPNPTHANICSKRGHTKAAKSERPDRKL